MKISLATNFDDELIEKVKQYNIYELYGKLNYDIIGGGRASNYLHKIDKSNFENHVRKTREAGINFNYLLNSACLDNQNQNPEWIKNTIEFLKYLKDIGVNHLTICNPYLLELIKKYFPKVFTIRISSFACIDTFAKAAYWEKMGADILCLDFCKVNRNFFMLEHMAKNLKCKIELLCTNSCLKDCPMIHTHVNDLAHASSSLGSNLHKYEDWGLNFCQRYQLNNLEEYIKSPWIRPEDIEEYEKIGIEHFKITERVFSTEALVKRVKAYTDKTYDGNLLDLIQGSGLDEEDDIKIEKLTEFSNRQDILKEIEKVRGIGRKRTFPRHIYIDNKKIKKNFINFFKNNRCTGICSQCNYCKNISQNVIKPNQEVISYLNYLYDLFEKNKY